MSAHRSKKDKDKNYISVGERKLPYTVIRSLRKSEPYEDGVYFIDRSWIKSADSRSATLRKKFTRNHDNVLHINFKKARDIATSSDLLAFVGKERKKDFSDPEVIKSMTIRRTADFSPVLMPNYEKCFLFLDDLYKMKDFKADVLFDLVEWNCVVFITNYPQK